METLMFNNKIMQKFSVVSSGLQSTHSGIVEISEFAATSLLSVAKELRTSDNATIAANVYINPDLSPADAKLAFEQRQRKRERKLANAPTFQAPQQTTLMVATTSPSTSSTQALSTPSSATTTTAQPASAKRIYFYS